MKILKYFFIIKINRKILFFLLKNSNIYDFYTERILQYMKQVKGE